MRRLSYSGGSNKKLALLGIGFVLQLAVVQQQYIWRLALFVQHYLYTHRAVKAGGSGQVTLQEEPFIVIFLRQRKSQESHQAFDVTTAGPPLLLHNWFSNLYKHPFTDCCTWAHSTAMSLLGLDSKLFPSNMQHMLNKDLAQIMQILFWVCQERLCWQGALQHIFIHYKSCQS